MSINLTPFQVTGLCQGSTWTVPNVSDLAEHIARIAVGQADHVAQVLSSAAGVTAKTNKKAIESAVEILSGGANPHHRDGWVFQAMSWIAAHKGSPQSIFRTPHMIHADKGFDGLQVDLVMPGGPVQAVVIFEDKATDNPRKTVREKVWPEFKSLEEGERMSLLVSEVTTLLKAAAHPNAAAAVEKIVWEDSRRYRISITVQDAHKSTAGLSALFGGYASVVSGQDSRRRAEAFYEKDLRVWMDNLATEAIKKAKAMKV
jgi:hypothetical protein